MIRLGDRPLHSDIYIQARQQIITRRLDPSLSENINEDTAFHELNAWLLLHRGRCLCRMRSDFKQAQKYIDAALAGFRRYNDKEGEIWTLVEKLVLCYHAQDFAYGLSLFDTIELDNLQAYLQAELLFGRFLCAIGSDLLHDAEMAGHQALEALERETDPWLQRIGRIQMLRNQAAVYHYLGKSQRAVQAAEKSPRADLRTSRYQRARAVGLLRTRRRLLAARFVPSGSHYARPSATAGRTMATS